MSAPDSVATEAPVEELIPLLTHYDETAVAAQASWRRFFVRSLLMLAAIACMEALHGTVPALRRLGLTFYPLDLLLELVALVSTAAGIGYEILHHQRHQRGLGSWTRARARAEALRSEVWRYLFDAHPLPYIAGYPDAEWRAFAERLEPAAATLPAPVLTAALAARKAALQALPVAARVAAYTHERLGGQRAYFTRKTRVLHRRATRLRHLTNGLLLAAVGWNLLRIWETVRQYRHAPPSVLPIGELDLFIVFIALAGLLKAWREAEGTERLVNTYQHMLARLHQLLAARPPADAPETTLRRFITDCENTLSAQNQEWGAGRG